MSKTAQTTSTSPTCHGYGSWHRRFADGPCRAANRLVPFADQP